MQPKDWLSGRESKATSENKWPKDKRSGKGSKQHLGGTTGLWGWGCGIAARLRQICTSQRGKKEPMLKGEAVGFETHHQEGTAPTTTTLISIVCPETPQMSRASSSWMVSTAGEGRGLFLPGAAAAEPCGQSPWLVPTVGPCGRSPHPLQQAWMLQGHRNQGVCMGPGFPSTQSSLSKRGSLPASPQPPP